MIRGTRIIEGDDAKRYAEATELLRHHLTKSGFDEIIVPALWEQQTFIDKAGPEIVGQMYAFPDKKGRPICLIPEVTGLVQEMWRDVWQKELCPGGAPRMKRIFYIARCYRYEKPQAGRYREFTQVGVELLGGNPKTDRDEVVGLLQSSLDLLGLNYEYADQVKRGLSYYVEDGFEASCSSLGAQRQVAGGGRYAEGIGWAIGLDRALLARQNADVLARLPKMTKGVVSAPITCRPHTIEYAAPPRYVTMEGGPYDQVYEDGVKALNDNDAGPDAGPGGVDE